MTALLSPLRKDRLTGSRIPPVLNLSPYRTSAAVLREMVRQHHGYPDEFVTSPVTDWGNEHEHDALGEYERLNGLTLHGHQEFVIHPVYEFLGVSLDARADDGIVEAKCPWRAVYSHISERDDYMAQCQAQLACTGCDWCDFIVWRPDRPLAISTVLPEPGWLENNLPVLEKFMATYWEIVGSEELSAPYLAPLVDERIDPEWQVAAYEFLEAAAALTKAELAVSDARKQMITLAGNKSARGFGVSVIRSERRGSVEWPKLAAKHVPDVDVEEFRKASSVVFTVRQTAADLKEEAAS